MGTRSLISDSLQRIPLLEDEGWRSFFSYGDENNRILFLVGSHGDEDGDAFLVPVPYGNPSLVV
jgi:hypothetical protein